MQFIGVDLHTNKFTCCYRDGNTGSDGGGKKTTETFALSAYGITQFCGTLTKETYVLVEATITTFCFARIIQPLVKEVVVANTYELKQISLARKNTDKIDADILDLFNNQVGYLTSPAFFQVKASFNLAKMLFLAEVVQKLKFLNNSIVPYPENAGTVG